jgi:GT2 family glycosyltransferase
MPTTVSVITANLDGRAHLQHLLTSLRGQLPEGDLEVIVVDNGSSDDSRKFLRAHFPEVRVIANDTNVGFARANNQGAEVARGRYLALLNNDTRLGEGCLARLVQAAEGGPEDTACVGATLLSWDGTKIDFADAAMSFAGIGFQPGRGDPPAAERAPREVLFASGAAMLVDAQIFRDSGGFDEDYFAYYEDVDLGWRLWVLGYRVLLCPDAIVFHRRNASQAARHRTVYLLERNAIASMLKNYEDRSLAALLPAALLLTARRGAARAGIERSAFAPSTDGRRRPRLGRRNRETLVARAEGLASLAALERLVFDAPEILEKRRWIQERRRRSDSDIAPLFGTPLRVGPWPPPDPDSTPERQMLEALGVVDYLAKLTSGSASARTPDA